jgi:SAM-dependent methyltransferase
VELGALRRHWSRLGRRDPLWAVLTHPAKERGGWVPEEFFRAGVDEVEALLRRAAALNLDIPRRRALDFGCGVGRITQALAPHFDHCDGVDISRPMLRAAAAYNRHPTRCSYHLNAAPNLALFADATFSFAYSTLVLQHMEPRYSRAYIRELLRVLAPDGVLVFQLPNHRAGQRPDLDAARTPVAGRLPAAAFDARLTLDTSTLSLGAGEKLSLAVTVENRSTHVWNALPDASGRFRINVANHWRFDDGELLQRDDGRCPLPHDVAPGGRVTVLLTITSPRCDGAYELEIDLVQENVGWFAERGSEPVRLACQVHGGLPAPRRSPAKATMPPAAVRSFRERHPRTFGILRDTGVRDIYWRYRRGVDRIKARRDRAIRAVREPVFEHVIVPAVGAVAPAINWWKRRPFAPKMEMHCVPRAEVVALLAERGGRLVEAEEELTADGFMSCRYWVRNDRQ